MKFHPKITHATISYKDYQKQSAIIFDNIFILTSGLIWSQIQEKDNLEFDVISRNHDSNKLIKRRAKFLVKLESKNVAISMQKIFSGFKFKHNGKLADIFYKTSYFSSFVLLAFENVVPKAPSIIKGYFSKFTKTINEVNLLDDIVTVTTPFGNDCFHKTVNLGKISNIFGQNNCLFSVSNPLVFGCEGGGVFDKNSNLIGIVVSSTFFKDDENIYFTTVVNLKEVFEKFLEETIENPLNLNSLFNSVVFIDSVGSWGTGVLVQIHDKRLVLTCSHVIKGEITNCYGVNGRIYPKLIYKNPNYNSAYDIAVLEVSGADLANGVFHKLSEKQPEIFQKLYSVGFPIVKMLGNDEFKPSIFEGKVVKYEKGILYTDCSIQKGQSGGPMFDKNQRLVAIAVSNFKSAENSVVYPQNNMCIPICDIFDIFSNFTRTNEKEVLEGLQADLDISNKWKLRNALIISKI